MPRIIRTASALQDVYDIWDYIAIQRQYPEAADRLIDEIDEFLNLLLQQPELGEPVDHLRPNTRRAIVHNHYLIFYEIFVDGIRVLRVLHGSRLIGPEDLQR